MVNVASLVGLETALMPLVLTEEAFAWLAMHYVRATNAFVAVPEAVGKLAKRFGWRAGFNVILRQSMQDILSTTMIRIQSLNKIDIDTLYAAWSLAFSDYEISWTKAALAGMLKRRGYDAALSFGAFDADGQLVSFTLNGVGDFKGMRSAYDTGTGTVPAFRGLGLSTQIFTASIPFLKDAGVTQYLLEVLERNTTARNIYEKAGFRITRTFNCFLQDPVQAPKDVAPLPVKYMLREIPAEEHPGMRGMWDFGPSWQNSFESIARVKEDFIAIGVFEGELLVGYGICHPSSGDITQLAVAPDHRRLGIGAGILRELLLRNTHSSVKAINVDSGCDALNGLLEAAGIPSHLRQYEMMRAIP